MLTLSGITVRLGGRTIIDDATANLPPRGRIGLIGRNGAGKSTLVRVIAGMLEADSGSVGMPRGSRIGYIAQDAPGGDATPFETVLAADTERAALMTESEISDDPHRLAEIHDRLIAIDAHSAPARAARILVGLGFDEEAQHRSLETFSGGWRMRVALAALLFSQPDLLLLDEPSNHLDLEAVLWLEDFLRGYPATILLVSHERDFLNNVVDHILHLSGGKLTLYPGGYDAFERQRAERQAQLASARAKQQAERERLRDYVARNSARASTAKQAQSRAKALARMQPIAELIDDPSLSFDFPSPDELRPPLITLDLASVGYGDTPVLSRLNLRLDPDDRIALLGRNGNGKTTLARLLAAQLAPMEGAMNAKRQDAGGLFHPVPGRGTRPLGNAVAAHDRADEGRDAQRRAGAARAVRLFGGKSDHRGRQAVGRRARPAGAGADHARGAAHADPRRADQPPRRRCPRSADPGAQRLFRRGGDRQP